MKTRLSILILWVALGGLLVSITATYAVDTERIAFNVAWYDVGKAALDGLPGVKKVTSGWHHFREINTVEYDPAVISVDKMIAVLKEAGTYNGIVK